MRYAIFTEQAGDLRGMFWCRLFCMSQENLMYVRNIALQTCQKKTIFCLWKCRRLYKCTFRNDFCLWNHAGLGWIGVVRSQYRSELQDRNLQWVGLESSTAQPHRVPSPSSRDANYPDHIDPTVSTRTIPTIPTISSRLSTIPMYFSIGRTAHVWRGWQFYNSLFQGPQLKT